MELGNLSDTPTHSTANLMPETENDGAGEKKGHRTVYLNRPQPSKYCDNAIYTVKYRYKFLFFVPMFLFEQFRRYTNIFFLVIALLQQIPGISPTGRWATLVPLIIIMIVSATKEIIEDLKRHKEDDKINNKRKVKALRDQKWPEVVWREVKVGDIVYVKDGDFFPCDLVLLSSSEPQAVCYVETANLDGETNLKIRQGLRQTANVNDTELLRQLNGHVECELPNKFLYTFTGNLKETDQQLAPLAPEQLLLRGARLKNTKWVYGLVIYTGHETKLMKNLASSAPLKRSTLDKQINNLIILLFSLLMVLCLIMTIFASNWPGQNHWYLALRQKDALNAGMNFLTFMILLNNLIPISLQVTVEIVRIFQAGFIDTDKEMVYKPENGDPIPSIARTSNLNEELGMVKYVLSDKTGTLTCNIMEFKKCSINGKVYSMDDNGGQGLKNLLNSNMDDSIQAKNFLIMMALCHTVIPDINSDSGEMTYHAASPDERALVEGANQLGFIFETRTSEYVIINVPGKGRERYDILNVLEFTSSRKRMSVVVKTPEGKIKLLCKGADNVIYERLREANTEDEQSEKESTNKNLDDLAAEGLRTLIYAEADISNEFYEEWNETFKKASTDLQNRERKLEEAAQLIENKLKLLGATAIEDRLQDHVPETIANLLKAGIHVWVLTGDKQKTAINIGHSCRLLNHNMHKFILNHNSLEGTRDDISKITKIIDDQSKSKNEYALIVDGKTLIYCLNQEIRKSFMKICLACKSIICCRVSPSQKAEVVELLTEETQSITLAIGDGANDVAMIQAANVGVGIAGQEGLQAVAASDYAIGQFHFLGRLLFVHGAWNYNRLCKVILFSFYKNIFLYIIELWWASISGWSGQVLFERWSLTMYNTAFTSLQPLAMGIFDRSCSAQTRMLKPELYRDSQNGSQFNFGIFIWWIFISLIHSVLVFILPYLAMTQDVAWSHGKVGGYLMTGNMVYTYVIVIVSLKAGLETDSWTLASFVTIFGSVAVWFLFLTIFSQFWPTLPIGTDMTKLDDQVFYSPIFWFGLILIPLTCLLLDIVVKIVCDSINKTKTVQARHIEIANKSKRN